LSRERNNINIFSVSIFTRNNPIEAQAISVSNLGSFDPTKSIKLIIHGFTDKATNKWVINMKNELLKAGCDFEYFKIFS
jgi:hypothetical protein